jgi:hypothetical protein
MIETLEAPETTRSAVQGFTAELQSRMTAVRSLITDLAAFAGQMPAPESEADVQALLDLRRKAGLPGYAVQGRQRHDDGGRHLHDGCRRDLDALASALGAMLYSSEPYLLSPGCDGLAGLLSTAEPGLGVEYMFDLDGQAIWRFDTTRTGWDSGWRSLGTSCSVYAPRKGEFDPIPTPPAWVEQGVIRRGLTREEQIDDLVLAVALPVFWGERMMKSLRVWDGGDFSLGGTGGQGLPPGWRPVPGSLLPPGFRPFL